LATWPADCDAAELRLISVMLCVGCIQNDHSISGSPSPRPRASRRRYSGRREAGSRIAPLRTNQAPNRNMPSTSGPKNISPNIMKPKSCARCATACAYVPDPYA
jgi:hypothetical protein